MAPTWNPEAFFNVMVVNGVSLAQARSGPGALPLAAPERLQLAVPVAEVQ